MAKYVPKEGHKIEYFYHKEVHTGTINWVGGSHLTVFPTTKTAKDSKGQEMDVEWVVEYKEIIKRVTK